MQKTLEVVHIRQAGNMAGTCVSTDPTVRKDAVQNAGLFVHENREEVHGLQLEDSGLDIQHNCNNHHVKHLEDVEGKNVVSISSEGVEKKVCQFLSIIFELVTGCNKIFLVITGPEEEWDDQQEKLASQEGVEKHPCVDINNVLVCPICRL